MPALTASACEEALSVAIGSRCVDCPGSLPASICGLSTRERLEKTLQHRGHSLVPEADAQEVVPPCRVYIKDETVSVCREGKATVESRMIRSLVKDIDGPTSRHVNRRISGLLTRVLMHTPVRPNQFTFVILLVGIASGPVIALGGAWLGAYWAGVLGALLLQTQSVLDGTDGELARLKFQFSKFGEWLDTVSDDLSNLSFLIGGIYVASHSWVQWVGLAGVASFLFTQPVLYTALAKVYGSGNLQVFQWDVGQSAGLIAKMEWTFKRDFFCWLFLGLALADQLEAAVVIFAGGMIFTAITLVKQLARWGLKPPRGIG